METKKKLAVVHIFWVLLVSSCMHPPAPFDEGKWRTQVESQSVEKLYEPHFGEGRYFHPWLPPEPRGFWRFLRWKLSRKANYTDEERTYLPNFIPGLKQRIQW